MVFLSLFEKLFGSSFFLGLFFWFLAFNDYKGIKFFGDLDLFAGFLAIFEELRSCFVLCVIFFLFLNRLRGNSIPLFDLLSDNFTAVYHILGFILKKRSLVRVIIFEG